MRLFGDTGISYWSAYPKIRLLLVSLSQDKVAIKTVDSYYYYRAFRPKGLTIVMPILLHKYFVQIYEKRKIDLETLKKIIERGKV